MKHTEAEKMLAQLSRVRTDARDAVVLAVRGSTPSAVAEILGVTANSVLRWCAGKSLPSFPAAKRILGQLESRRA